MAQNISPDRSQSSNLAKQNDEAVTIKDNHAVSKRFVSHILFFPLIKAKTTKQSPRKFCYHFDV